MTVFSYKDIQKFINTYNDAEIEKKRENFVQNYTKEKIKSLSLKEYVVGFGKDNNSFCYRLETELECLGDIHGSPATKFGLYYGKSGQNDTEKKYRISAAKFGKNINDGFEEIKDEIINLIDAGENNNTQLINKSKLAPVFRGKILSTYYPEKYLNIFSEIHLKFFLQKLNLKYDYKKSEILLMQEKILEFKNSDKYFKNWKINTFSAFLYKTFGRPHDELKLLELAEEQKLLNELNNDYESVEIDDEENLEYEGQKIPEKPIVTTIGKIYPRKRRPSLIALKKAKYTCEIDANHESFIKRNGLRYTEPHHLVPMSQQGKFKSSSLDVSENIVSLCSNCHNEIHYGKNADKLIEQLYNKRKGFLINAGINIDIEKLKKLYN